MREWEAVDMGQIAEILSSKRVFAKDYTPKGVPFWRGKEVVELSAGNPITTELYISEETYQHLGRKVGLPKAGDILLTSVGTLGRAYKLNDEDRIYFKDGNLTWFRNFSDRVDPQWLLYWMRSSVGQSAFEHTKIGSTQQALTIVNLKALKVLLPPLPEQRGIAAILGALDDKIEVNRKASATLEAMARALYRSWFVDFDPVWAKLEGRPPAHMPPATAALFPDSFDDNGLPLGWSIFHLSHVASLKNGFAFKSNDWNESGVPAIKIGSVKPGLIEISNNSCVSEATASGKDAFRIMPGAAAIGLTGYVGEVGRIPPTPVPPLVNQRVARIDPISGESFSAFVYTVVRGAEFKEFAISKAYGSAQANVSTKDLLTYEFSAETEIINAFNEATKPLYERQLQMLGENQTLATLRDSLLPKLMSGEIRVGDARAQIKEIA